MSDGFWMPTGRRTNRALSGLAPDTPARAIMRSSVRSRSALAALGSRP